MGPNHTKEHIHHHTRMGEVGDGKMLKDEIPGAFANQRAKCWALDEVCYIQYTGEGASILHSLRACLGVCGAY